MGMIEDTRYIDTEIDALINRLQGEGMDLDLVLASLLDAAADGYANMGGAAMMSDVFRETADQMDAGEYTRKSDEEPRRPSFRVIEGGGGSKV